MVSVAAATSEQAATRGRGGPNRQPVPARQFAARFGSVGHHGRVQRKGGLQKGNRGEKHSQYKRRRPLPDVGRRPFGSGAHSTRSRHTAWPKLISGDRGTQAFEPPALPSDEAVWVSDAQEWSDNLEASRGGGGSPALPGRPRPSTPMRARGRGGEPGVGNDVVEESGWGHDRLPVEPERPIGSAARPATTLIPGEEVIPWSSSPSRGGLRMRVLHHASEVQRRPFLPGIPLRGGHRRVLEQAHDSS